MNRKERREQERLLKKSMREWGKKPKCHLHSTYSQEDIDKTKVEVKEFIKNYSFSGSPYEKDLEQQLSMRELLNDVKVHGHIIRLSANHQVLDKAGKLILTDVYLKKESSGWFLTYEKLDFQQNILVVIKEMGFENLFSNQDINGSVMGHTIANFNKLVRQAFDSLTLKFDQKVGGIMGQNKFIDVFGVGLECPFEKLPESGTLMSNGNIFIVFSLDKIREEEICYFQNGQWWFSLRQEQGHIVLASKVKLDDQSPPWIFEVMFSLNKTHLKDREAFLNLESGQAYPIHFLLVDKKTNIIKAMRNFGLSSRANKFLKDRFLEQSTQEPCDFDISKLPSPRKSFDSGLIKEKAGTK